MCHKCILMWCCIKSAIWVYKTLVMGWDFEMNISNNEDVLTVLYVCMCVFLKQINIFIFTLNAREWAFSLFRTSKEMVSYANCIFKELYNSLGYQSNLIKLWQLLSLTFLQLVKLWPWGKWYDPHPDTVLKCEVSIVNLC